MSDNDQFFDDCLGCGLEYDGAVLSPKVDGVTITKTVDGLAAAGQIEGGAVNPINGVPEVYNFPSGCNGLKYDCETGALWYPTPPCGIRTNTGSGLQEFHSAEDVRTASSTRSNPIYDPVILDDDCYEGMKAVTYGWLDVRASFKTHNLDAAGTLLAGYELDWGLELFNGTSLIFSDSIKEAKQLQSSEISQVCISKLLPFGVCSDPAKGVEFSLTVRGASTYNTSTTVPTMDFDSSYVFYTNTFMIKEC